MVLINSALNLKEMYIIGKLSLYCSSLNVNKDLYIKQLFTCLNFSLYYCFVYKKIANIIMGRHKLCIHSKDVQLLDKFLT